MKMFKQQIRMLRRKLDMTQDQVAEHLGLSRSTYAYYETGKTEPNYQTLVKLAKLFDVTVDYLLSGEDGKDASTPAGEQREAPPVTVGYMPRPPAEPKVSEWLSDDKLRRLCAAYNTVSVAQRRQLLELVEKLALQNGTPLGEGETT